MDYLLVVSIFITTFANGNPRIVQGYIKQQAYDYNRVYQFEAKDIGRWFDFYLPEHNLIIEIDGGYW